MTRHSLSDKLRRQVVGRAGGICEYCGNQQELNIGTFQIDHIYPQALGGSTTLDNLALACPACNMAKYMQARAIDPQTGRRVALYHPRRQRWARHFQWSEDYSRIIGRTMCGRATVAALQMNRNRMVRLRLYWRALGLHPPARFIK
jgi:hypothetical protein